MSIEATTCPLCGRPNRCGEKGVRNGQTLDFCWCAYEIFPRSLLDRVPAEKRDKACICRDCLRRFWQKKMKA
ncbi:MAG: cysteine-rich CWC family protein [Desulfosudaceae bacterium]